MYCKVGNSFTFCNDSMVRWWNGWRLLSIYVRMGNKSDTRDKWSKLRGREKNPEFLPALRRPRSFCLVLMSKLPNSLLCRSRKAKYHSRQNLVDENYNNKIDTRSKMKPAKTTLSQRERAQRPAATDLR